MEDTRGRVTSMKSGCNEGAAMPGSGTTTSSLRWRLFAAYDNPVETFGSSRLLFERVFCTKLFRWKKHKTTYSHTANIHKLCIFINIDIYPLSPSAIGR